MSYRAVIIDNTYNLETSRHLAIISRFTDHGIGWIDSRNHSIFGVTGCLNSRQMKHLIVKRRL